MGKQVINLTEQDIHFLVENTVKSILTENGMEERFVGGLGALGSKVGNRMKTAGQNLSNTISDKWGQAKDAVGRKITQAGEAMGQAYDNAKKTYQTGSANQDAQKAIQNAVQALNNLKIADQKLQSIGQYSVIGKQVGLIDQLIKVLQGGGAASISGRFQNRRNAFTN